MAKHAHRLMLNQKKTWRCTLPGCSYFIHIGLAHILPGKQSICWECGDEFTLDDRALRDDQPICDKCYTPPDSSGLTQAEKLAIIQRDLVLRAAGVKDEKEMTPVKAQTMRALGLLPSSHGTARHHTARKEPAPILEGMPDEIEVYEPEDDE